MCAMHTLTSLVLIIGTFANVANADDRAQVIARSKISVAKVVSAVDDKGSLEIGTGFLFATNADPALPNVRPAVEKGYLLTNWHVVKDALKVDVHFVNLPQGSLVDNTLNLLNSPVTAKVVGLDALSDLAVLEVGPSAGMQSIFHLPTPLPMARPESIHAGDEVLSLGFALNLEGEPTVNRGIISALNRSIPTAHDCADEKGQPISGCLPWTRSGLIQTDATINHGNSGGPLLNMAGEVVGINTYTTSEKVNNIYYARSVETAAPFAKMLLTKGAVIRADLGLKQVESVPADYHVGALKHGGVRIVEFSANSPAQKAGLRVGEIITSIQIGNIVPYKEVQNIGSLLNLLAFIPPGSIANVVAVDPNLSCPKGESICLEKAFGKTVAVRTDSCPLDRVCDRPVRPAGPAPAPRADTVASVDPALVGTWEAPLLTGRWVLEIGAKGTFAFRSEAVDGVPSRSGTFSANNGHWSLQATDGYHDEGTYTFQSPSIWVATSNILPSGNWHRVANGRK
jgi:S1-C subfamily serine protease